MTATIYDFAQAAQALERKNKAAALARNVQAELGCDPIRGDEFNKMVAETLFAKWCRAIIQARTTDDPAMLRYYKKRAADLLAKLEARGYEPDGTIMIPIIRA
jgi:hypothetical protein